MKLSEIGKAKENYRDELYQTHNSYTIGVNDGKEFRNAIFTGTKLYHGKPMLTFVMKTEDNEHINLNINQSYLSYSIEEPMEDKQDG
jgi:hypothetical protein|tara:strand:- start:8219 stop:8479 length:261 start_codon:yes stop_codon:yes gene_type:complete